MESKPPVNYQDYYTAQDNRQHIVGYELNMRWMAAQYVLITEQQVRKPGWRVFGASNEVYSLSLQPPWFIWSETMTERWHFLLDQRSPSRIAC